MTALLTELALVASIAVPGAVVVSRVILCLAKIEPPRRRR